jgi:formylglycine-generating enzyme required for sulfatase activity
MEDDRDYYTILGVPAGASEAEIRQAFRARAKEHHPDGKPDAEKEAASHEFNLLTEAHETLKDPQRRQAYDEELKRSRQLTPRGKASKPPSAFVTGLGLGLCVAAILLGTKVYFDRTATEAGPKNQESLAPEKPGGDRAGDESSQRAETPGQPAQTYQQDRSGEDRSAALEPPPAAPAENGSSAAGTPAGGADGPPAQGNGGMPAEDDGPAGQAPASAPDAASTQPVQHSEFAQTVLTLEGMINSGGGSAAAYKLASLVNSAKMEELVEASSLAQRPETLELIGHRIAALRQQQAGQDAGAGQYRDGGTQSGSQDRGTAHGREGAPVAVATGQKANETIVKLTPGNGLTESFSDCPSCPEMVVIPNGQAIIGSKPESAGYRPEEGPAHKIIIRKPLAVSKYGISAENWRACVEAGICRPTLSSFLSVAPTVPATRVSWFEAKAYAEWLSQVTGRRYRLLSEAEWEYAARSSADKTPAEGTVPEADAGVHPRPGNKLPAPVKPNAWGLHPLAGNTLEWVEDCWHTTYAQAPSDGTPWLAAAGGDCAYRAVRGVAGPGPEFGGKRLTARAREFADARSPTLGFRVAREVSAPAKTALDATSRPAGKHRAGD